MALLVVGLVALCAAVAAGAVAITGPTAGDARVARSLASIEQGYSAVLRAPARRGRISLLLAPLYRPLLRLGTALTPVGQRARLQRYLDYAGNPPGWIIERVLVAKAAGLLAGEVCGVVLGLFAGGAGAVVLGVVLGPVAGFLAPDAWLYGKGRDRQEELRLTLPDVLDTLTICVEAGQGFDAALAQVARNGRGPLMGETARVLQEMRIGKSRAEALRSLAARTTVPELKGFASAVVQASDLGVPVAQVLREQSREMRLKHRQRAEETAQKIPVKILFPTLLCLFPALFIVVIGPGVLSMVKYL
jgi:tight adherence protein C